MKKVFKSGFRTFVSSVLALFIFSCIASGPADAAQLFMVYSAKISCGTLGSDRDVVKGQYATAVNIHNPNGTEVTFTKMAVIAFAERSTQVGPISKTVTEVLGPDQAMYVDCADIKLLFGNTTLPQHYEGFLVISVPQSVVGGAIPKIDVWAKYTARHRTSTVAGADPTASDVESFSVVEVTGKQISR